MQFSVDFVGSLFSLLCLSGVPFITDLLSRQKKGVELVCFLRKHKPDPALMLAVDIFYEFYMSVINWGFRLNWALDLLTDSSEDKDNLSPSSECHSPKLQSLNGYAGSPMGM